MDYGLCCGKRLGFPFPMSVTEKAKPNISYSVIIVLTELRILIQM